jgi:hypothetical protein
MVFSLDIVFRHNLLPNPVLLGPVDWLRYLCHVKFGQV